MDFKFIKLYTNDSLGKTVKCEYQAGFRIWTSFLAKKKQLNLGDIAQQKLLLLEEGHCLRGHILDVCLLAGVKEQTEYQATSLETLRHMVGEGMGMTLMPELMK